MAPERNSAPLLDEREPPFLQEPTVVVETRPLRPTFDEIVDFLYRWRLALALGLAPVVLAAIAVSYDADAPSDPVLSAESGRSSDAIVVNAEVADEATPQSSGILATGDIGVSATLPPSDEPVQTSGGSRPPTTDDQAATSSALATASTAAPPTSETTTPTSEPTATTTEAPTTTTTEATTTSPPETVPGCLVTLKRRANVFARPDDDSDRLGRVARGTYPGLGRADDGDWYRIAADGATGWVKEKAVSDVEGDC